MPSIDTLDDVQEHLVLPVADALRPSRHGVRDRDRRAHLYLELVQFLRDILLQDLALRHLDKAENKRAKKRTPPREKYVAVESGSRTKTVPMMIP